MKNKKVVINWKIEIFKIIQRIIMVALTVVSMYLLYQMVVGLNVLGNEINETHKAIEALQLLLKRSIWF